MTDNIHLRNIRLPIALCVGPDVWHRPDKPQLAVISVRISYPTSLVTGAAQTDTVSQTLDYGKLYRAIEARVRDESSKQELDVCGLSVIIAQTSFDLVRETLRTAGIKEDYESISRTWEEVKEAEIWIHLPQAMLRADQGLMYRTLFRGEPPSQHSQRQVEHKFTINGIRCYCILGINPHERREKQAVLVTLVFCFGEGEGGWSELQHSYQSLTQQVAEEVDASSFQTVEALATYVARIATTRFGMKEVTVRAEKPSAQPFVEYSGVEITRNVDSLLPRT